MTQARGVRLTAMCTDGEWEGRGAPQEKHRDLHATHVLRAKNRNRTLTLYLIYYHIEY